MLLASIDCEKFIKGMNGRAPGKNIDEVNEP